MRNQQRQITDRERLKFAWWLCALMLLVLLASIGCEGCVMPSLFVASPTDIRDNEYGRMVIVMTSCEVPVTVPGKPPIVLQSGRGSGVRIGGHSILTAEHVVDCPVGVAKVTVKDVESRVHDARVVATLSADVARLEVDDLPTMSRLAIAAPELGTQACAVVGVPEPGRVCGEIEPSRTSPGPGRLRVRFVAEHGNSGAGVFNEEGVLIGILVYLFPCKGTDGNEQVCEAGVTALVPHLTWIAAP